MYFARDASYSVGYAGGGGGGGGGGGSYLMSLVRYLTGYSQG